MKRKLMLFLTAASLVLALEAGVFWVRGLSGVDEATLRWDRYRADGFAASDAVSLTSDTRLWLGISSGSAPPFDGQLVRGYHVNADMSGGKPSFTVDRSPYKSHPFASEGRSATHEEDMSGWGPLRWEFFRRSGDGEHCWSFQVGVSHWLVVALLLAFAARGFRSLRRSRTATAGLHGEQAVLRESRSEQSVEGLR